MNATAELARAMWIRHFLFPFGGFKPIKKYSLTQIQNTRFIFNLNLDDRTNNKVKKMQSYNFHTGTQAMLCEKFG
jgi:hypothetical protein